MTNPRIDDLSGKTFGEWCVLRRVETPEGVYPKYSHWLCQCSCGVKKVVSRKHLGRSSVSCGHVRVNRMRQIATKHGHAKDGAMSSEYRSWLAMKNRCSKPSNPRYQYYGGRGVTVCQQWSDSFTAFLADMGPKPTERHSIDRIDPNGNYEPGNCRWATAIEQRKNRRDSK